MCDRDQFTIQSTRFPKTRKLNNYLIYREMIGDPNWEKNQLELFTIDSCYNSLVNYYPSL